ncbi:hypothetical protein JCM9279_000238 [Rhodotorula babjevae]
MAATATVNPLTPTSEVAAPLLASSSPLTATATTSSSRAQAAVGSYFPPVHSIVTPDSRRPRTSDLYMPLEASAGPSSPTSSSSSSLLSPTADSPISPFGPRGARTDSRSPGTPTTPLSPSDIHPAYAASPSVASQFHLEQFVDQTKPQLLHSSINFAEDGAPPPYSVSGGSVGHLVGARGRGQPHPKHALLHLSRRRAAPPTLGQRFDSPHAWLALYFAFNLGLTLFNKLVLQGFPFPWTLTAIQMLAGTAGTQALAQRGSFPRSRLTSRENVVMVAFSALYTVNIAVSNLSLHLVSVPFHQVVRAMTPLFTIAMTVCFYRQRYSRQTYLALVPVVAGVAFATYGDYSCTPSGFLLTLVGTFLAALKGILTNRVQVGRLKLHPLDLLARMSPLAFVQCFACGWASGELARVNEWATTEMTRQKALALVLNGAIAFGLNVVSFTANKRAGPLTMTVLTIVLAVAIFNVALNPTNILGISLTLAGGAWYAKLELQEKSARAERAAAASAAAALSAAATSAVGDDKC